MRSASPRKNAVRLLALCGCCLLLAGALAGCETTQEKAAAQQAESAKFLKEREARRTRKHQADGTKSQAGVGFSSRRHKEEK